MRLFLSPERSIEVHGSYEREIASLTYGWDTPDGEDPTGEYLAAVRRYLLSALGEHVKGVFWDCPCLPQEPRSASEETVFGEALGVMALWPLNSTFYFADAFVFEAISRRYWLPNFVSHNAWAVAKETLTLGPLFLLLTALRWRARRRSRPPGTT